MSRNCLDCAHEFRDAARSGDPNARLCRPCWDGAAPPEVVAWIFASVINEVGMVDRKARNCPGWSVTRALAPAATTGEATP